MRENERHVGIDEALQRRKDVERIQLNGTLDILRRF